MKRFAVMLVCAAMLIGLIALTAPEKEEGKTPAAAYAPQDYSQVYAAIKSARPNNVGLFAKTGLAGDAMINETSGQDHSNTNVQVEGIDEGDLVKTDGEYIYAISGNSLLIFKVQDGKADRLCSLDLSTVCGENFYAYELYVLGDTIAVTGATSSDDVTYGRDLSASVYVFDISSRTAPKLSGSASQDGYFVSSRLYDGKLYLVSAYYIYGDISKDDPVSYIPRISENGKESLMPCSCICIMPGEPEAAYCVAGAYDARTAKNLGGVSVLGGGDTVSMSPDNLYVAAARYSEKTFNGYAEDQYYVEELKNEQSTVICRISLDGLKESGCVTVPGILDGQFAMDEYDGMLRVVTCNDSQRYKVYTDTKRGFVNYEWGEDRTSENALYIFDGNMKLLSSVEGLAKGEYVRSVRFDGDYAYFCTFRQVDPLFAVCLSDPKDPTIQSEYKISGFSEYLHPWSDGLLFGLGNEAEEDGDTVTTTGLKLVMFDVSDKADVSAEHTLFIEGWYSESLYDHNALLVSPERGIIGFTVDNEYCLYSYSDENGFEKTLGVPLDDAFCGARGLYIGDWLYVVCGDTVVSSPLN